MSNIQEQKPKFSVAINTPAYQKLINNTLGDPNRAKRFVAAITSAVAVNPALQDCEAHTILAGALLGESLNLSPSPQLGQYYLVPFNDTKNGVKNATFILGYKGYIQLAIRSGQYKKINVIEIKEGELKRFDPLNEELEVELIDDWDAREKTPTVGYYAMFEYTNGFRKAMYWTREKMMSHADTYSKAFSRTAYEKIKNGEIAEKDMWKYSSFWYKNFDDMAKKTMLRQIISHWGVMSLEMQSAFERDDRTLNFNDDGNIIEVDEMPTINAQAPDNDGEIVDLTEI
ncbi:MAG: recombinase RecT [Clostridia bacterium]|nr:recombinase RecT [Clostridia bacterium]